MSRDFVEMLFALCDGGAEFLVVGAHALAVHGRPRATGDLDLWVRPTPENAQRVLDALVRFGAPITGLQLADLTTPDPVYAALRIFDETIAEMEKLADEAGFKVEA